MKTYGGCVGVALLIVMLMCGCRWTSDPPMLQDFPPYSSCAVADSGDFRDILVFGMYTFEDYSETEMASYMEKAVYFQPMTEEALEAFSKYQHNFDVWLAAHETAVGADALVKLYYDDALHISRYIAADTTDYYCKNAHGFFVYDTASKTLYHLSV